MGELMHSVSAAFSPSPAGFEEWYDVHFSPTRGYLLVLTTWIISIPAVIYFAAAAAHPNVVGQTIAMQILSGEMAAVLQVAWIGVSAALAGSVAGAFGGQTRLALRVSLWELSTLIWVVVALDPPKMIAEHEDPLEDGVNVNCTTEELDPGDEVDDFGCLEAYDPTDYTQYPWVFVFMLTFYCTAQSTLMYVRPRLFVATQVSVVPHCAALSRSSSPRPHSARVATQVQLRSHRAGPGADGGRARSGLPRHRVAARPTQGRRLRRGHRGHVNHGLRRRRPRAEESHDSHQLPHLRRRAGQRVFHVG